MIKGIGRRPWSTGFTLVELVVYLTLASLVAVATTGWMTAVWQAVGSQSRLTARQMSAWLVMDTVRRDLLSACRDGATWDQAAGVFRVQTVDERGELASVYVGWSVQAGTVRRYSGSYDLAARRWITRTVSIAGRGCRALAVTPVLDADRRYVDRAIVEGTWGGLTLQQTVNLRHQEV